MKVGDSIVVITGTAAWLLGLVLAKGFWSTACAFFLPPWAWYLLAERLAQMLGLAV